MWTLFIFDIAILVLFLYGTGVLLSRVFYLDSLESICVAPLLAFALLYFTSCILSALKISVDGIFLVVALLAISLVVNFIVHFIRKRRPGSLRVTQIEHADLRAFAVLLIFSSVICVYMYVLPLDGPASFLQEYDNYYHLAQIRDYLDSGYFASLPITAYPNLWHSICAVVANLGMGEITVAVNAVNFVLLAFVSPISIFCFFKTVFKFNHSNHITFSISLVFSIITCAAFPWNYAANGPLYAMLIGGSVAPVAMLFFIRMIRSKFLSISQINSFVLFLICTLVCLVAHPSMIFFAVTFLTPACVSEIWHRGTGSSMRRLLKSVAFILFVCTFWLICFNSPKFAGVVGFDWGVRSSVPNAVVDSFLFALPPSMSPNYPLAFLALIGAVGLWRQPRYRWLISSFIITMIMYIASMSFDGVLKQVLSGFWYTDQNRMAAMYSFASIPLISYGVFCICAAFNRLFKLIEGNHIEANVIGLVVVIAPILILTFAQTLPVSVGNRSDTAMGYTRMLLYTFNNQGASADCYDAEEISFMNEVKHIVGESNVLNYPYDGSCYAYSINDVQVLNRTWTPANPDSNQALAYLGEYINEVDSNSKVVEYCRGLGVKYIVLLDYGHLLDDGVFEFANQYSDSWSGFLSLDDSTGRLETVLKQGDMRLYRINGV